MPSGEKTGKMTKERVAAFKAVMYKKTLAENHKEFNEVSKSALGLIRSGSSWPNIKPADSNN